MLSDCQMDDLFSEVKEGTLKNSWELFRADSGATEPGHRPSDPAGYEALDYLQQGYPEVSQIDRDKAEYVYYGAVKASKTCLECHHHQSAKVKEGDLIGMA